MKIVSIKHQSVPIRSSIRNAVISFSEMTVSVVVIETDVSRGGRPLRGYGFTSNGRYSAGGILEDRMIPRLLKTDPASLLEESGGNLDPFKAWDVMMRNEKPGGHGERTVAVGAIDMALWDLVAKVEEKPLYRVLAERFNNGKSESKVSVYAAGGYYYPGKDVSALQDEIRGYLDQGYDTVKMKIGGAPLEEDLKRIEAVEKIVGASSKIAVDANGRFDADDAVKWGNALAPYRLKWYEEPVDPLDYAGLSEVAQSYEPALATGENLFSLQDSRNLILFGGMRSDRDFLQMDPALSYGLVEYLRILEMLEEQGWSRTRCIPHGGHQFALHIAAGLGIGGNESYPGVFEPFGGFGDGVLPDNGYVELPGVPGIGIELKSALMRIIREIET
jgi:L-alanine-DL-glutamate epimerase-like enolase superfamily enzyme